MVSSTFAAGALLGVLWHVGANAARSLPLYRSPWLHVGFGVAGGYGALYYEESVAAKQRKVEMLREAKNAPVETD